jgi:hypothetical protein
LVKDVFESDEPICVYEHDIFNLLDGERFLGLSSVHMILEHFLKIYWLRILLKHLLQLVTNRTLVQQWLVYAFNFTNFILHSNTY